ncbi:adenosylcobinamide-GDP ribazoletransferase [Gephyromycinifex aptenodytis]|uniref:adenosylcobinamide-GDP ribazoletransferase n=1 Tax=Gephyromycinifex aptenodytis TaxID=2716227 RepID=UPI001B2FFC97|nr:adenosylcobinamide-GDP ribazoletransferase [Gephyromycinifex aptenodytis]
MSAPAPVLLDAWRLAAGMLSAVPVTPPSRVDTRVAGAAMLLAPIGAWPVVLWWLGWGAFSLLIGAPALLSGAIAVTGVVLATRAMHLDGLADVADALSASYDRERALQVMKTGDVGPSGAAGIAIVLGLQVSGASYLAGSWHGIVLGALALLSSRWILSLGTARGIPSARPTGLGATFAGSVHPGAPVLSGMALGLLGGFALSITGGVWWQAPIIVCTAAVATALLVRRCVQRFGGITGDVLGAGIEISAASALVMAALLVA